MFTKKEHPAPPVEPVQLKRKWNLEPPVYLTIIWASILIALFYVIAILPGNIKSGRYYTFSSPVQGSAIYLDGEYIGSGTVTEFVPSGTYTLRYEFRDAGSYEKELEVRNVLLFTHLFPRKYQERSPFYLSDSELGKYYDELFSDVIRHSAILSYDDVYHYPPLLTYAAQTAGEGNDSKGIISFLKDSALFITSDEMAEDMNTAVSLIRAQGADTSSLDPVIEKIRRLSFDSDSSSQHIAETESPLSPVRTIMTLDDFSLTGYTYPSASLTLGYDETDLVYPGVHEMAVQRNVSPFTIGESEVSEYLYARFIEENPSWSKTNRVQLIEKGLVDESYLDGSYPTTAFISSTPIRNISYYAAVAFTEWLSHKSGRQVTLMSEAEFESASLGGSRYSSSLSSVITSLRPSALLGGVWEITGDTFVPLERYLGYAPEREITDSMVIIKGGSYLNSPEEITRSTIGLMAKDDCSDSAGFRIVWR